MDHKHKYLVSKLRTIALDHSLGGSMFDPCRIERIKAEMNEIPFQNEANRFTFQVMNLLSSFLYDSCLTWCQMMQHMLLSNKRKGLKSSFLGFRLDWVTQVWKQALLYNPNQGPSCRWYWLDFLPRLQACLTGDRMFQKALTFIL